MTLQSINSSPAFINDDTRRQSLLQESTISIKSVPLLNRHLSRNSESTSWIDFHRDLSDGGFRGAIFGFSDGLATNLCLVVGVQVALDIVSPYNIIMTGIAGLLAGAFSMGCGEYISMRAQSESQIMELNRERGHLKDHWKREMIGLRETLQETVKLEESTINQIMHDLSTKNDSEEVLTFHAKMELNIDPEDQGSPWKAAIYSFICFSVGAFIPLIPYFILQDNNLSYKISIAISVFISCLLGFALGKINGVSIVNTTIRQMFAICFSAACSVGINYGFSKM